MNLLINVAKDLEIENLYSSNNEFNANYNFFNHQLAKSEECFENTGDLQLKPSSMEGGVNVKSEEYVDDLETTSFVSSEKNTPHAKKVESESIANSTNNMKAKDVLDPDTFDKMKRIMKEARLNGTSKCPECDKQFTNYQVMATHLGSTHLNFKFPCKLCEYQGTTLDHLRTHVKIKHEELKLQCDQCVYQANRKDRLTYHIQSKHERITFDCNKCPYKAPRKDKLKRHIQTIHEGANFVCDQCDYQANRRDKFNSHLKSKH